MPLRRYIERYIGIIGIILFLFILVNLDLSRVFSTVISANLVFIGLSLLPMAAMLLLQAYRWMNILRALDLKVPFSDALVMFLAGYFYGSITPGKVGDFIRSKFLSNRGEVPLGLSFATVFLDRVSDLIVIFYLGCIGLVFFVVSFRVFLIPMHVQGILLLLSVAIFYALLRGDFLLKIINNLFFRFLPATVRSSVAPQVHEFTAGLGILTGNRKLVFQTLFLGIVIWLSAALGGYLLLLSLHAPVSYEFTLFTIGISTFISLIPVSVNGLGTREITIITLFSLVHLSPELAFGFSLIFFCWNYLAVLPGVFVSLFCRKRYIRMP